MYNTDILIIGAGVVGLAVAEEAGRHFKNVVVMEKCASFGQETSSRNSEVIHAGIYYPPGSLKAELCVRGRELLYDFCMENNVPHKKTGKLIVAVDPDEIGALESLFRNALNNGVSGLRLIGREEMRAMEPNVFGLGAIYSSETGIIDSHIYMQRLIMKAKTSGVTVVFSSEVVGIKRTESGYNVTVNNSGTSEILSAKIVINCAGLDSDTMAMKAGIDIKKCRYELRYCKGQYFRVNGRRSSYINRLVYPVPKPKAGGLGIHATPDLSGGLRLGPDHEYLENRAKDYSVSTSKRPDFYVSASKFMPFIEESDISADTSGIRPQLKDYGSDFRDFIIKDETDNGLPGLINLIGIESPGLTASLAIGEYVLKICRDLGRAG